MSPNEAAELLGVPQAASADEVQRAYAARLVEAGGDGQRSEQLAAARDALLAAAPWRAPGGAGVATPAYPQQPSGGAPADPAPQSPAAASYPQQAAGSASAPPASQPPVASYPPQQPPGSASAPQLPAASYPPQPFAGAAADPTPQQPAASPYAQHPSAPAPGHPPQPPAVSPYAQHPAAPAPGYPTQQPPAAHLASPQPAPGGWYAPPPPPPPRRPMSTGAIVGITLGGIAAGLVVLLVAVFAIASIGASAARVAEAENSATPVPYEAPSDEPSDEPSDGSAVEDYDVDGVHVHYVDGWTFELTPAQTCAGATVTAGFADTPEGDTLGEWSTTVDFEAGVPVTFTIPDSASTYGYAGIESVQCGQA